MCSRPASAIARRPPALADPKGRASQFVAEQLKPDEKVAWVGWLESVAIASSVVTMRAQRAFTSAYVDISCCNDGWFIGGPCLKLGTACRLNRKARTPKRAGKRMLSSVPNVRQVVDETDRK